ncbi:MAG: CAP domain-containing protein [Planctomycetota bacterium]
MKYLWMALLGAMMVQTAQADGMDEVNEWRRRTGLPPFIEDPKMTEFAKAKARYRAERGLQNGHQGPKAPSGWHEGTGEATASWGWLTCEMESQFKYAGAGMCVAPDGTRYMVLVCRGGSGRALVPRNNAPVHNTSYLTPKPPRVTKTVSNKTSVRRR